MAIGAQLANIWGSSTFPWEATAVILTMLTFSVSAIAYMLSRVFMSKEMEKWAKIEFMYALSGVVIMAFLIFTIDFLAVKATEFSVLVAADKTILQNALAADQSPFAIANVYVETMQNCIRVLYVNVMSAAFIPKVLSGGDLTGTFTGLGSVTKLINAPLQVPINLGLSAIYSMTYLLYSLSFQHYLLQFARETMMTIFLPIGIVLRAFPFTRSPGNLLIAVAIGFYFVYPVSYGILLSISRPADQIVSSCGIQGFSDIVTYINTANPLAGKIESSHLPTWLKAPLQASSTVVTSVASLFMAFTNPSIFINIMLSVLDKVSSIISEVVIYAIFYPFVIAVLTYTFIKGFSTFLGVEAQDFAQGLVKLV